MDVNMNPDEDLVEELVGISHGTLDHAQVKKKELEDHQLFGNLRHILRDMKDMAALNPRINFEKEPKDPYETRLDNILVAEEVVTKNGRGHPISSGADKTKGKTTHVEKMLTSQGYRHRIAKIRKRYYDELLKYHNARTGFNCHLIALLQEHNKIRPIYQEERERIVEILYKKFYRIEVELKRSACEAVMQLRTRALTYARKVVTDRELDNLDQHCFTHLARHLEIICLQEAC